MMLMMPTLLLTPRTLITREKESYDQLQDHTNIYIHMYALIKLPAHTYDSLLPYLYIHVHLFTQKRQKTKTI